MICHFNVSDGLYAFFFCIYFEKFVALTQYLALELFSINVTSITQIKFEIQMANINISLALSLSLRQDANNTITLACKYQTRLNLCIYVGCRYVMEEKCHYYNLSQVANHDRTQIGACTFESYASVFQIIYSYIRLQIAQSHKLIIPSD